MLSAATAKVKYGTPNKTGKGYLVTLKLPFPMRLAWDTKTVINSFQCHKDVHDQLKAILTKILAVYGLKRIQELGIDLYGGCFEYRPNANNPANLSLHCWGLPLDLDPLRNKNKENHTTARFARAEYKPMIDIFYEFGYESLGRERDYDWMHFQPKSTTFVAQLASAVASVVPITGSVKKKS